MKHLTSLLIGLGLVFALEMQIPGVLAANHTSPIFDPATNDKEAPKPAVGWNAFSGGWQIAGASSACEGQIKAAIYKATENMNFLTRRIAREKLKSVLPLNKRIYMQYLDKVFVIHPDTYIKMTMPVSGETVKYEDRQFRISLDNGAGKLALRQIAENGEGKRENVYRLQEGGKTLDLEVTVTSPQIPAPVQFKLQYARVN